MSQSQVPTTVMNDGDEVPYIPAAQVYGGDVVLMGSVVGVAMSDIAAGTLGALRVRGRVKGPKDASTFAQGDAVYWNSTGNPTGGTAGTGCFTSTAGANKLAGMATFAQATGDATVTVLISPPKAATTAGGAMTADSVTGTSSTLPIAGLPGSASAGGTVTLTGGAGNGT